MKAIIYYRELLKIIFLRYSEHSETIQKKAEHRICNAKKQNRFKIVIFIPYKLTI